MPIQTPNGGDDNWIPGGGTGDPNGTSGTPNGGQFNDLPNNVEYGRVMDIISEGPCHGPATRGTNMLKSIYLVGTPIVDPSTGVLNFKGFVFQANKGTKTQAPFAGFPETENEVSVGVGPMLQGNSTYNRTVSTSGLTHLRIRVFSNALKDVDPATGKEYGGSYQVQIKVDGVVQTLDNGGWVKGQYDSKFVVSYKVKLSGAGPWTINVSRLSADADSTHANACYWGSYTEIIEGTFYHPWTSKAALQVDARQFQSIPSRAYLWDGRIIKVPSNYTPAILSEAGVWTAAVYTGNWDGTFKDSPTVCFNPAWQFFDMATHTRYGLGNYLDESKIDKWGLYAIGVICDQMVSDGLGGSEPRMASSVYLQKAEEATKVMMSMASAFRGMLFYAAGKVVPVQNVDKPVWAIFSNSNVVDGVFTYSGTAKKSRHNSVIVSWNDPKAKYELVPEPVEYAPSILKFGIQPLSINHFGCFSRGQAIRFGQWTLYSEYTETDTVVFNSALEGLAVAPGKVIQINDSFRSGSARFGGRVLAGATVTSIPLDGPVTLLAGHTYSLRVALPTVQTSTRPDGATVNEEGIKTKVVAVTNGAGTYTTLTVATLAPDSPPQEWAQWLLADDAVAPMLFNVLNVKESSDGRTYEIAGLEVNPNKFALADSIGSIEASGIVGASAFPPVTALAGSAVKAVINGSYGFNLKATWTPPSTASPVDYRAEASLDNGQWIPMVSTGDSAILYNAIPGVYRIRCAALYRNGNTSIVNQISYTLVDWSTQAVGSVTLSIAAGA